MVGIVPYLGIMVGIVPYPGIMVGIVHLVYMPWYPGGHTIPGYIGRLYTPGYTILPLHPAGVMSSVRPALPGVADEALGSKREITLGEALSLLLKLLILLRLVGNSAHCYSALRA